MVKEQESSLEEKVEKKTKVKVGVGRIVAIIVAMLVALALIGASVYFYLQYQKSQDLLKNPATANQAEVNSLVQKVGKHYDLPTNDTVTVATVSDVNKLSGQVFFAKAKNGDKVLIYPKSGIAILYRPSTDKIVNVGPVNTQDSNANSQSPSPAAANSQPVNVVLYNATQTNGLTTKVASALGAFDSVKTTVVSKGNATGTYPSSIVVDLTGKNAQAATLLATFVKGKVGSLPAGEIKPTGADILIILGDSYVGTTPTVTPSK